MMYINCKTARRLKDFLGDTALLPRVPHWYRLIGHEKNVEYLDDSYEAFGDYPAYQLHDILTPEFCETLAKKESGYNGSCLRVGKIACDLFWAYHNYGIGGVEVELARFMQTARQV